MVLGRLGELGLDGCGLCLQARYIVSGSFRRFVWLLFCSVLERPFESLRAGVGVGRDWKIVD